MDIKIAQFRIEHLTGAHRHRFTVSYLALQIWEFILEVQKESIKTFNITSQSAKIKHYIFTIYFKISSITI